MKANQLQRTKLPVEMTNAPRPNVFRKVVRALIYALLPQNHFVGLKVTYHDEMKIPLEAVDFPHGLR